MAHRRLAAVEAIETMLRYRRIFVATSIVEFRKRYAGSFFGVVWVLLMPALILIFEPFGPEGARSAPAEREAA